MRICWVTNDVWFSRLLRYIFKESTSHVGVLVNVHDTEFAFDINNPYGSMYSAKYWLHKYRVVHSLDIPLSEQDSVRFFKFMEERAVLRPYDIKAYYYGMWRGLLRKLFGLAGPKTNKGVTPDRDMCQEVVRHVMEFDVIHQKLDVQCPDLTLMTPDMTMKYMKTITSNTEWTWSHNV